MELNFRLTSSPVIINFSHLDLGAFNVFHQPGKMTSHRLTFNIMSGSKSYVANISLLLYSDGIQMAN